MVKKQIFIFIFLIIIILFIYPEYKYTVGRDTKIYDSPNQENRKIISTLLKNQLFEIVSLDFNIYNIENNYGVWVKIKNDNNEGWIFSPDINVINQGKINNNIIGQWTKSYYFDVVKKNDLNIIIENEYKNSEQSKQMNEKQFLYYYGSPFKLVINNSIISYYWGMGGDILLIDKIEIKNNKYIISGLDGLVFVLGKKLIGGTPERLTVEIELKDGKISVDNLWEMNLNNLVKVNNNDIFDKIFDILKKHFSKTNSFFTPNTDSLRLRESPDLKGKFIRSLIKGEKLELIEKSKSDTINGVKGNWIKVKTEKGEIGWCFDGYLEEVKDDNVKKN